MTTQRTKTRKLAALAILPFAAALAFSACGSDDAAEDTSNVNIEPVENTDETTNTETELTEPKPIEIDPANDELTERAFRQTQGGVDMTLTYTAIGDRVIKQTTRNVINYEAAGFGDKAQAQEIFDPMLEQSAGIEGYDQTIEYGETEAVEELTIDYEVVDLSQLSGLPGFEGSDNVNEADFISLSQSLQMLEQQGFTEVE